MSDLRGLAAREALRVMGQGGHIGYGDRDGYLLSPGIIPNGWDDMILSPHFREKEFRSHDYKRDEYGEIFVDEEGGPIVDHRAVPVPKDLHGNLFELAKNLEVLRKELGGKPITVFSGYRTPFWNEHVGGAEGSKHMKAQAADISVKGVSPRVVYETAERLIRDGKMKKGGLHRYNTFTHYDIRGENARW